MYNEELVHYGVLGMRWGQHMSSASLNRTKRITDSGVKIVGESKNISSEITKNKRRKKTESELSNMTDQQLQDRVKRMNLEQQYSSLSAPKVSKGASYTQSVLSIAGSALVITSSALGIALAIKELKS